jgi:hypothetical protein
MGHSPITKEEMMIPHIEPFFKAGKISDGLRRVKS